MTPCMWYVVDTAWSVLRPGNGAVTESLARRSPRLQAVARRPCCCKCGERLRRSALRCCLQSRSSPCPAGGLPRPPDRVAVTRRSRGGRVKIVHKKNAPRQILGTKPTSMSPEGVYYPYASLSVGQSVHILARSSISTVGTGDTKFGHFWVGGNPVSRTAVHQSSLAGAARLR
jgi:hypothetical protein